MTGPHLDHLALANTSTWELLTRYYHELGCTWLGGPELTEESAFSFCQVGLAKGTKLEFLQPIAGDGSDFLRRFLDRNGSGPHHFTFKVPDFDEAVKAVEDAGHDVVGIDRSKPDWQEGFLHPKQSHGIVIQLACQGVGNTGWEVDSALPPSQRDSPPALTLVRHLVADLDAAVQLFSGPLAMTVATTTNPADGRSIRVTSGPWTIELIEPKQTEWLAWMGDRPGRLLDIHLEVEGAADVIGAVANPDGTFVVPADENLGTTLTLTDPAARTGP